MGVRYSATESANLIAAMKRAIEVANRLTDQLSNGCDHLLHALDSGELQGAAYAAGGGLFTEVIVPAIKKLQAAVDDMQAELVSYEYADSTISEYGILDRDLLEQQLLTKYNQLDLVVTQLEAESRFYNEISSFLTGSLAVHQSRQTALLRIKTQLEEEIGSLEERIRKLDWFVSDVSYYFSDSLAVLELAVKGTQALSQITVSSDGNYYTNGVDMSWLSQLKKENLRTYGRGTDPQRSLINQHIRELMLTDEAASYYRQELTAYLSGTDSTDWPEFIQQFNQQLTFDDEGNILAFSVVKASDETIILVYRNGKCHEETTQRLHQELAVRDRERLGEYGAQLLSGVASLVGGLLLNIGSLTLGAGGLALALPTGGTVTVPAEVAAATGLAVGTTLVVGGAVTIGDALAQVGAVTTTREISFVNSYDNWQATKPTSKTFGKPIEAKVGGRKVKIRVDAEPNSGKVQIQSGGGKSGYSVNRDTGFEKITNAETARKWLDSISELKKLTNFEKEELVKNILKAVKWLKS